MGSRHRITAPWLTAPGLVAIFDAIEGAGHAARSVGGSVRDTLLGDAADRSANDIDVATTATPEEVTAIATDAGLEPIPTGLPHGTITIIAHGEPYEVTTLRADLETDGRRATVSFTDDWAEDASRRDFTINALYCDRNGEVFDYVGGGEDLENRVLRFIGDPAVRIREDYLRVLRLFRFMATLPSFAIRDEDIGAAVRGREGLSRLSRERVGGEMMKLLAGPGVVRAVTRLIDHGLWAYVLPTVPKPQRLADSVEIQQALAKASDPKADWSLDAVLNLTALAASIEDDALRIGQALRLSNQDANAVKDLTHILRRTDPVLDDEVYARRVRFELDHQSFRRLAILQSTESAGALNDREALGALLNWSEAWTPPVFPVSGKDLIAVGFRSGPAIGERLAELQSAWLQSDFRLTRDELLAQLNSN